MKKITVFLIAVLHLTCIAAYAQSLGDLAKEEQKRRDSVPANKTITIVLASFVEEALGKEVSAEEPAGEDADIFSNSLDALWDESSNLTDWLTFLKNATPEEIEIKRNDSVKELFDLMKDHTKDFSPEEKAIYKKMMEDQMNGRLSLMELQYKKLMENETPKQKMELEDLLKEIKQLMEQSYKEVIEAIGL